MADLSFAKLNTALGTTAFSATGSVLSIDLNLLMGEAAVALTDEKVAEFLTNLLELASEAETAYNADVANTIKLNSYFPPTSGIPSLDTATNNFYVTSSYNFSSRAPLNKAATTAVTA